MALASSLTPEHVTILPERILRYIFSFYLSLLLL